MRKILLLIILLLSAIAADAYDFKVGGLCYNILVKGEVEVTYESGSSPQYISLSSDLVIPESVTKAGTTYSVTSIGDYAFRSCSGLTSVTIPNSVTSIGNNAFYDCTGLANVTIGNSVTSIGTGAFRYCPGLTSVTIGNSVTSIGGYAFYNCSGLTSVTIPNSVTSIGVYAFQNCSGVKELTWNAKHCESNGSLPAGNIERVTFGNQVEVIPGYLLSESKITSVTIPNSVTTIGNSAFYECSGLTSVTIPNSVTSIGGGAFDGCTGLTSVTIPNSVTSIGRYAFYGCSGLTSVTIPNSVTSIGGGAFEGCTGLTSVTIPNSVTSIGNYAFWGCSGLTSVTIPNSVTYIGDGAFSGCSGLTSIVSLPIEPPSLGYQCFGGVDKSIPVYVINIDAYQAAYGWKEFTNYLPLGNTVSLQVNLPSNASDGRYKDMYVSVTSADSTMHNRCIITDKTAYTFHVPANTSYNVSVSTSTGAVAGEKRGVPVGSDDMTVNFDTLLQPQTVSIAVTLPDGVDITENIGITWSDNRGNFVAQGRILNGMIQGQELNYDLKLPQEFSKTYVQPAKQNYTVKSQSNSILVQLRPFGAAKITGSVLDASTGRPLPATITASQLLNGKQSKSVTGQTDNRGQYTLDLVSAPVELTASAQGYVSQSLSVDNVSGSTTLEPLRLNPITGTVVQTRLTYRPSASAGQTAETLDRYDDYQNVSFTIRNTTRNKTVTPISVQYPEIVLSDDVADGDKIEVTAHSLKGDFNDVKASCVIGAQRGDVTLPLVERGGIEAQYTSSEAASVSGMLYNSAGEQVARDVYSDASLSFGHLPDGNYTLVTMQTAENYNSVLTLDGLSATGLTAGKDYKTSNVSVTSGTIARVETGNVPQLNSSLTAYTGSDTRFTANKTELTIGNYVTLSANINFKKAYQNGVSNLQLLVDLPEGCDFVSNSVLLGNSTTSYILEDNHLSVAMPNDGGLVKFCAIPTLAGMVRPSASVRFSYNGKTVTEPIGAATFETKNLEIRVPSVVAQPEVLLSGACPLNSRINVYDNEELIGSTTSQGLVWSLTCTLPNAFNLSTHEIYAKAITPQGRELTSETATCTYDKSAVEVSKVTMFYDNAYNHSTYEVVFDFINQTSPQRYDFYSSNDPFAFKIDFTQNDTTKITNVILKVKTSNGTWETIPASFDENQMCWAASRKFTSSGLPVNVAVSYDYLNEPKLSAEVFDASIDYYNDLQTAFREENVKINQTLTELETLWNSDDYNSKESEARRHELYESLGITIDDAQVEILTDEQMDSLLAECEKVLADSLGFQPDLLFQQSFEEINSMTEGFSIGHCTGMTEARLLEEGYQKMEKDDGTSVYIFNDESTMKIADLANDMYYEFDLQADNALLSPLIELAQSAQSDDDFLERLNDYSEKINIKANKIREKLTSLADLLDDIFKQLLARANTLEHNLALCNKQINYLKSIENQTLDQSLRLAKYNFYQAKYTKELAINNEIRDFLLDIDTKSLRLGKIKLNGITGIGKYVKLANKAFVVFDIISLLNGWKKDVRKIFDTYFMIPSPCKGDEVGAFVMRTSVASLGISAGAYYFAQFLLTASSLSTAVAGGLAALPSGGTTLGIVAVSIGVAVATYQAARLWDKHFDRLVARQVNSIKLLSCYRETGLGPELNLHYAKSPDAKPVIDPSGFVFEAVPSNRLQGVTATIYYKETVEDMYGNPHENEVLWNAEEYAQKNPLFTDENGMYQWDVPQGLWQVRFNKTGYEPTRSEWLPVPPPQLDVNIGMTQLRQPEVAMVHAYKDAVEITFDKYMRQSTLTADNIQLMQNNKPVSGTIELLNAEQGNSEMLASKIQFVPASELAAGSVTLTVKTPVESYAGMTMNSEFRQSFDVERRVRVIAIDTLVNVGYGESRKVAVAALPADIASGATMRVSTSQPVIADVDQETITLDKHGRAEIIINGNLPGSATLTLSVDGFDLRSHAKVLVVDESSLVTAKPVASLSNGKVFADQITVELTCETPGAKIYYTLNGACPCDEEERILYNGPITISGTTTLKAIAIAPDRYESDIATYYYFQSSAVTEINPDSPVRISPTVMTDGFVINGIYESCDVRVYSISGTEVLHKARVRNAEPVSLAGASNGIYIAVVTVNGRPYPTRIIKTE